MTGVVECDYFDLKPCIRQHIETLKEMRDEMCKGFGTKDEDALAMLWYANDQGRKMCADLKLLADQDTPEYDRVALHVPVNLLYTDGKSVDANPEPDLSTTIYKDLEEKAKEVAETEVYINPVGDWTGSGSTDMANTFLTGGVQSPYLWVGATRPTCCRPTGPLWPRPTWGTNLRLRLLETLMRTQVVWGDSQYPVRTGISKSKSPWRTVAYVRGGLGNGSTISRVQQGGARVEKKKSESVRDTLPEPAEPRFTGRRTKRSTRVRCDRHGRCSNKSDPPANRHTLQERDSCRLR